MLEDLNIQTKHVMMCLETALEDGDTEGAALARILLLMSKTQRRKLADLACKHTSEYPR